MRIVQALLFLAAEIQPGAGAPPFRQPQLAAAYGQVALAYGDGRGIYFSASQDGGRTFSPATRVAATEALALGRHRGPKVTILRDAVLVSAVAGEHVSTGPHAHGLPADGNIVVWRSVDRGKTWARASVINDVPGSAREGFHAIAEGPNGSLSAVWLDLREKGTRLYASQSSDGGRSWSRNALVYASPSGTICECCGPSVAVDPFGSVSVMWRNFLDGSRDLYLATSKDGSQFSPARKLGTGTWKLNACPMDGGWLGLDRGRLTSVWRREGEIFRAEPDLPEQRIGSGKDVAAVGTPQGLFVVWSSGAGLEILSPGADKPRFLAPEGAFANLVALPDGSILAAWEVRGAIHVEKIPSPAHPISGEISH